MERDVTVVNEFRILSHVYEFIKKDLNHLIVQVNFDGEVYYVSAGRRITEGKQIYLGRNSDFEKIDPFHFKKTV